MAAGHVNYVWGMFVSVIELSPRDHLNWAPCYNLQAHIWSLCFLDRGTRKKKKKRKKNHPSSWAFSFVSVIAIDFCLNSVTLWQPPKSKSLKFKKCCDGLRPADELSWVCHSSLKPIWVCWPASSGLLVPTGWLWKQEKLIFQFVIHNIWHMSASTFSKFNHI